MNASRKDDNISVVTSKLFGLILKMPLEERRRLLSQVERNQPAGAMYVRRKFERQDSLFDVDYSVNDRLYKGFALNFSANGVFIESPKSNLPKFSNGDQVMMAFDHPGKKEHVKISGRVARVAEKGLGVQFDHDLIDWWTI